MPYTLVSAATIGFDLVRLPAGRQVAEVLLTGLGAAAADLHRLAAAHPRRALAPAERAGLAGRGRRARELAAAGVPRLSAVGGAAQPSAAQPSAGRLDGRLAALASALERSTIGDAAAVERLVRTDVVDVPDVDADVRDLAVDVLADAAVAAFAAGALPADLRRTLAAPWHRAAAAGVPPEHDLGPQAPALRALLAAVRDTGAEGRRRWRAAVDAVRAERRPWAAAMHDASWAAHVSGRVRAAAAAQLLAVPAFDDAGFDAADGAQGVWNALAGCVQGVVLADLLDASSAAVLTRPWALVTGQDLLLPG
ncbi:hypothetical protein [Quadrisphaera sp. DSM 44207]|uniref:hypothetical protein n=1 Tax=Quadrisphaera sp. DSM 44207 TaxID=1881057 RepID=UPI00088B2CF2|nr:hypothetical protein [Quadrisphaera sp. DSM 44207]SDQ20634.1 hypothetical protein SAMN05428996_1078 [Quadrisphaera sp. DSM 44207]